MKLTFLEGPDDVVDDEADIDATNELALFFSEKKGELYGSDDPVYVALAQRDSISAFEETAGPLAKAVEDMAANVLWRQGQDSKGRKAGSKTVKDAAADVHAAWQKEADKIWLNGSDLKKTDVALQIKVNLHCKETVDTISRNIEKPTRKYKYRKG